MPNFAWFVSSRSRTREFSVLLWLSSSYEQVGGTGGDLGSKLRSPQRYGYRPSRAVSPLVGRWPRVCYTDCRKVPVACFAEWWVDFPMVSMWIRFCKEKKSFQNSVFWKKNRKVLLINYYIRRPLIRTGCTPPPLPTALIPTPSKWSEFRLKNG